MRQGRVPLTVSLPPDMAKKFDQMAKGEAKNKSQLFRTMFLVYQQQQIEEAFFALQRYGVQQAKKKSIFTEEDVEALVLLSR